jgi:hypothetical protein
MRYMVYAEDPTGEREDLYLGTTRCPTYAQDIGGAAPCIKRTAKVVLVKRTTCTHRG